MFTYGAIDIVTKMYLKDRLATFKMKDGKSVATHVYIFCMLVDHLLFIGITIGFKEHATTFLALHLFSLWPIQLDPSEAYYFPSLTFSKKKTWMATSYCEPGTALYASQPSQPGSTNTCFPPSTCSFLSLDGPYYNRNTFCQGPHDPSGPFVALSVAALATNHPMLPTAQLKSLSSIPTSTP